MGVGFGVWGVGCGSVEKNLCLCIKFSRKAPKQKFLYTKLSRAAQSKIFVCTELSSEAQKESFLVQNVRAQHRIFLMY